MLEDLSFHEEYLSDGCRNPLARHAASTKVEVVALEPYAKMFSIGSEIRSAPLFCAPEVKILGTEIGWFRALGLPVDVCTKSPDMLGDLLSGQACWSMVIIDCDSNGGIEHVLGQLRKGIRSEMKIPSWYLVILRRRSIGTRKRQQIASYLIIHFQLTIWKKRSSRFFSPNNI